MKVLIFQKLNHDSVRINVKSIGVNYADILLIKGKYQERPRPPFSPGLEISGIVSETGSLAKTFKVGDRVMSIMKYGGYKTEVVIPQENTYFIPEGMDFIEAGGFPVVFGVLLAKLTARCAERQCTHSSAEHVKFWSSCSAM